MKEVRAVRGSRLSGAWVVSGRRDGPDRDGTQMDIVQASIMGNFQAHTFIRRHSPVALCQHGQYIKQSQLVTVITLANTEAVVSCREKGLQRCP